MASIELKNVSKSFGKTKVIENLNLSIADGKFTVLVGPSGCGKTTLLRMIAGIGPATSGEIYIADKEVSDNPPGKRDVAMVFQNYAIYPTMTVRQNIEFGLKNKKVPKAQRDSLIAEICEIVGLSGYLERMPGTLSGGQRQRVALARAMVKKPAVFLMDEPLSNLDAKLRVAMRVELIELHKRLQTTFIYVTHDQVEAMSMADTIVLMNEGEIQQEASPEQIYRDPNNVFTAQFIGMPPMNLLPLGNTPLTFGFRPEKAVMSVEKLDSFYCTQGTIVTREMLGAETIYKVITKHGEVMIRSIDDGLYADQDVTIAAGAEDIYLFDKLENRIRQDDPSFDEYMAMIRGLCQ